MASMNDSSEFLNKSRHPQAVIRKGHQTMLNQQIKKTIIDALMNVVDSAPTNSKKTYEPIFQPGNPYQQLSPKPIFQPGNPYQQLSPKPIFQPENPYTQLANSQTTVSKSSFDIWMNYVFSVLKIAEPYINPYSYLATFNKIQNVSTKVTSDYTNKTLEVCKIILDFARQILSL